ncbi:DMT family transporter [Wukongibacter baidiensis]|uniref:DMT family transporter n=1 Tax=Wukongibacter baidiensis TaxID=1723361 RepID=UPI003D7F2E46
MKGRIKIVIAMLIYGSIGVFVRNINLSPIEIAFLRAFIGSMFLLVAGFFIKEKYSIQALKQNILLLIISGSALGINWVLLFRAYEYVSVSSATLVYYLAPVFVILLSPVVLKERLNIVKLICVIVAMIGLVLIINDKSVVLQNSKNYAKGIIYSLSAAVFYSSVILMNKKIKNLTGFQTTLIQLIFSLIVLLPVILYQSNIQIAKLNPISIIFILVLGIVHTGVAYLLYFSSMKELEAQSIAIFCYVDPISAIFFASIFLKENISVYEIIGGILILGSTFLSEREFQSLKGIKEGKIKN